MDKRSNCILSECISYITTKIILCPSTLFLGSAVIITSCWDKLKINRISVHATSTTLSCWWNFQFFGLKMENSVRLNLQNTVAHSYKWIHIVHFFQYQGQSRWTQWCWENFQLIAFSSILLIELPSFWVQIYGKPWWSLFINRMYP